MKKRVQIMALLSTIFIIGCGETTSTNPYSNEEMLNITKDKISISKENKLDIDFIVKNSYGKGVKVELSNFTLRLDSCNVKNIIFRPENISLDESVTIGNLKAEVELKDNCIPKSYSIDAKTVLTLDGQTNQITFNSPDNDLNITNVGGVYDVNDTIDEISYRFKNPTPIVVTRASETRTISIDLIDSLGVGVSGKEILMTTLESKFGSISSSKVTTDASGKASFSYTAPSNFDAVNNQTVTVDVIYAEEKSYIKTEIQISFTEDSSDNTNADTVLPIVVIENSLKTIELTSNSKNIAITMQVFKDSVPYSSGTVKVELPAKVLNGVDVGLFEAYEVPVDSRGIATFNYTGPANLKALMDNNDLSSIFKFYHTENSASETRQAVTVTYNLDEDSYVPINYVLEVTTPNNDFSMGIPNISKTFSVVLKDLKGQIINNDDIDISKIEVSTENALIAKIMNTTTGVTTNTLLLKNENNSAFTLVTNKLSGIVPLRINVEFKDINNELKKLSTIVNIRVMSGPASAISISYVSTGIDASRAKYEEKFAISVTDEYGNKVNTRPYISLGALVGYAVDGREASSVESNETKRLYYGKNDIVDGIANGIVNPLDDELAESTNFEDDIRNDVFKYVNNEGANSDKLVVFGQGKNYEAMGKWDFSKIDNNTLNLEDDYLGTLRSGLSYAIGRNYYQDQCADDGREWLGSTDAESYQLDEEGTVVVSYKYDYHLTGKDALIWVNLSGYQSDTEKNTRIGEVSKHTLRGRGLESRPTAGYTVAKGTTDELSFDIHHQEVPEWYQNAHFGYAVTATECSYTLIDINSSNFYDARSCINGGVAYVTFSVTAPVESDCSFNIQNSVVANEF